MVMGNHDDLAPSITSRRSLIEHDMTHTLSPSQLGPDHLPGVSNYAIPRCSERHDCHGHSRTCVCVSSSAVGMLYMLDSGGGSIEEAIHPSQVQWISRLLRQNRGIPAIVFMHIPLPAYADAWKYGNRPHPPPHPHPHLHLHLHPHLHLQPHPLPHPRPHSELYTGDCQGSKFDEINAVSSNIFATQLMDVLSSNADVKILSVGHDHGNDFCCHYRQLQLCFGKHSGYGGYGTWRRGARVFQFADGDGDGIKTWIRMENGDILHQPKVDVISSNLGYNEFWIVPRPTISATASTISITTTTASILTDS